MYHHAPCKIETICLPCCELNHIKMKNQKYLNGVLTVIAVCLVILTMSVIGVFPKANAATPNSRFVSVPVNPDGSINVRMEPQTIMKVNIEQIEGRTITSSEQTYKPTPLPVIIYKH